MDNPHYDWAPVDRRDPVRLADGTSAVVTFIVPVEFFPLDPPAKPFKHPGAMVTPYPDLRHYTTRDYGNRVGVVRILRELGALGLKATFAVNAAVARRYPPLLDAIQQGGHEIAAHGVSTAHLHHAGLSEAEERALIAETRASFPDATTWMSPARNQSFRTMNLIAEAGFSICLDWEADMRPLALRTAEGSITALPHYSELSDYKLLIERSQSEDEWRKQIVDAMRYTVSRADSEGAGAVSFTLTPYVIGQPFRVRALRNMLSDLKAIGSVTVLTAAECAARFASAAK
jgi:peptidoglycan/xylan/chitin deacetylase (PgdA/CDA1 family)